VEAAKSIGIDILRRFGSLPDAAHDQNLVRLFAELLQSGLQGFNYGKVAAPGTPCGF
jgi:hypothetical protein